MKTYESVIVWKEWQSKKGICLWPCGAMHFVHDGRYLTETREQRQSELDTVIISPLEFFELDFVNPLTQL